MTFLRFFGKFLISVGVGILLFVVWTLKGTDLLAARSQDRLEREYAAAPEVVAQPRGEADGPTGPPADFRPKHGDPVFKIAIPKIDVEEIVVEGVDRDALQQGPGHYPSCRDGFDEPLCLPEEYWPGENGLVIVSGHRTTYGAPFWDLDKLRRGDEIEIETKWGSFTYRITDSKVVAADSPVFAPKGEPGLLLTTCHPKFSADQRLLVRSTLVEAGSA